MNSNTWIKNKSNTITVISNVGNLNLRAYISSIDAIVYNEFGTLFTKVGDRYFMEATPNETGTFIIRIVDLNGNVKDDYAIIKVVEDNTELVTKGDIKDLATKSDVIVATML